MRHGIVLFTSDRGIDPARAAKAAEEAGFDTFYVPEHTHIPVKRDAAHPGTGDETLPDDRYLRTLDPWVCLATAAADPRADPTLRGRSDAGPGGRRRGPGALRRAVPARARRGGRALPRASAGRVQPLSAASKAASADSSRRTKNTWRTVSRR